MPHLSLLFHCKNSFIYTKVSFFYTIILQDKGCALIKKHISQPTFATYRHDKCKGGITHYPYECPIEVQMQRPLPPDETKREIEMMKKEFCNRRKVFICGLPHDYNEEVSKI